MKHQYISLIWEAINLKKRIELLAVHSSTLQIVKQYILPSPVIESHCCRHTTTRRYADAIYNTCIQKYDVLKMKRIGKVVILSFDHF